MIYSLIPLFFLGLRDIKYQKVKIWHVLIFVAFALVDLFSLSHVSVGIILSSAFVSCVLVKFKIIQRVDGFILFLMSLILGYWVFIVSISVQIMKSIAFKLLKITEKRTSFLDSVFVGSVMIVCQNLV
jgi:hypothetical protein